MKIREEEIKELVDEILDSKKYRQAGLNRQTVTDLIHQEAGHHTSHKKLIKAVRRKLHNIVAPYLGEPDYDDLSSRLEKINNPSLDSPELQAICYEALSQHASTAERIPHMDSFYNQLFSETGTPEILLDLACGLKPLAFPWMGLPITTRYHAYDIRQPRIDFINRFFRKIDIVPLAENRDILVNPPDIQADLALFFKEAHRFEKRQPGCNRSFWANLKVAILAVSLPATDLSGRHSLIPQHRKLVDDNLPRHHTVRELILENEIVFLIEKQG